MMRIDLFTLAGVFFLFTGTIEMVYGGFVSSAPIFGAIGSPGLWGVLVGVAFIAVGTRKRGTSRRR